MCKASGNRPFLGDQPRLLFGTVELVRYSFFAWMGSWSLYGLQSGMAATARFAPRRAPAGFGEGIEDGRLAGEAPLDGHRDARLAEELCAPRGRSLRPR